MFIESYVANYALNKDNSVKKVDESQITKILQFIIKIAITIAAIYLSWNCNSASSLIVKILYGLLAGMFSVIYLIYYGIYRVLLKNACA